jgi:UDP-N-acetylmuramate--alanine ligase
LFDDFGKVLSEADCVVLTDVYPAGEAAIDGIDSRAMCQSIRARGKVDPVLIPDVSDIARELPSMLRAGDMVLLLGAGNIGQVAEQIRENGFPRKEAA